MDAKYASDLMLNESAVDCPHCGTRMNVHTTTQWKNIPHRPSPSHKDWKPGDPQIIAVNQMCFVCPDCGKAYSNADLDAMEVGRAN